MSTRHRFTLHEQWALNTGNPLYTDVQDRMLHDLEQQPLEPLTNEDLKRFRVSEYPMASAAEIAARNVGGVSLYATVRKLAQALPPRNNGQERHVFYERYGVTRDDLASTLGHTAGDGFVNIDFPHLFTAALANEVTEEFISQGFLRRGQKDSFSLTDWASMIETGWFGALANSMSRTGIGAYGPYGLNIADYGREGTRAGLLQRLTAEGVEILSPDYDGALFEVQLKQEPIDKETFLAASLHPVVGQGLRKHRESIRHGSVGCPVAAHQYDKPYKEAHKDPHIRALIRRGKLVELPPKNTDEARFFQEYNAIETTHMHIASQLRRYDDAYGTPRLSGSTLEKNPLDVLVHERSKPHPGILSWKG